MNFVFDTMTILLTRYDRFTNDIGCAVSGFHIYLFGSSETFIGHKRRGYSKAGAGDEENQLGITLTNNLILGKTVFFHSVLVLILVSVVTFFMINTVSRGLTKEARASVDTIAEQAYHTADVLLMIHLLLLRAALYERYGDF